MNKTKVYDKRRKEMKLYGSLNNRMEENKMFCKKIEVGTGMTRYEYSDRHAYEVVKVVDQTNVFVREYDHKLNGAPMSNDWKLVSNENNPVVELKLRNGIWYRVGYCNKEAYMNRAQKDFENGHWKTVESAYNYYIFMSHLTKKQIEKIESGKTIKKYTKFGNVSFGVADYHYDYEF